MQWSVKGPFFTPRINMHTRLSELMTGLLFAPFINMLPHYLDAVYIGVRWWAFTLFKPILPPRSVDDHHPCTKYRWLVLFGLSSSAFPAAGQSERSQEYEAVWCLQPACGFYLTNVSLLYALHWHLATCDRSQCQADHSMCFGESYSILSTMTLFTLGHAMCVCDLYNIWIGTSHIRIQV